MYQYRLYQFDVSSEIELPCKAAPSSADTASEIPPDNQVKRYPLTIRRGSLEKVVMGPCIVDIDEGFIRSYPAYGGILFILRLQPHCEPFDVNNRSGIKILVDATGDTITVDGPSSNLVEAAYYLVGLVLPVCLLHKGALPLHAACAEFNGKVVGIMGRSGAGKSTLLYTLLKQGALLAGDDLLSLVLSPTEALAVPSLSLPVKLRQLTIENYGIDRSLCIPVTPCEDGLGGIGQFWLQVEAHSRLLQAKPLSALFILKPRDSETTPETSATSPEITVERLRGAEALALLLTNTHGLWVAREQMKGQKWVARYAALLNFVPLYEITYSKGFDVLPRLAQTITDTVASGGREDKYAGGG